MRSPCDYALNLAITHEILRRESYDKDFVARFVAGMGTLRKAVEDTTPEWRERSCAPMLGGSFSPATSLATRAGDASDAGSDSLY